MLHKHKNSWSHNELFAHKKNTGEQAKLRDTMIRIERKFGLVKESIRQDAAQVRTSLKCIRKSTGHSIDALPPTPFQLRRDRRESTFILTTRDSSREPSRASKINPEFDYLLDEIADQEIEGTFDSGVIGGTGSNGENPDGFNECGYSKELSSINTTDRGMDSQLGEKNDRDKSDEHLKTKEKGCDNSIGRGSLKNHGHCKQNCEAEGKFEVKKECSMSILDTCASQLSNKDNGIKFPNSLKMSQSPTLPKIEPNTFLIKAKQGDDFGTDTQIGNHCRTVITNQLLDEERAMMNQDALGENHIMNAERHLATNTNENLKVNRSLSISKENTEDYLGYQSNNNMQYLSMPSREATTLTDCSERKLPSSFWTSPQSNIPTYSNTAVNRSDNSILQRRNDARRARNQTTSKDQDQFSQMRNTRTRCRTCYERYRQNLEFQRQKKLLEKSELNQNINSMAGTAGKSKTQQVSFNVDKSFLVTDNDLSSLFAESEVLDFEEATPHVAEQRKNESGVNRGYSKARLERLAEPRKGRRKKLLFSKHVIKKEVDDLTERHSQPLLTEKEKERIRILESKIRMFLAVTSASGMPSGMVHIPQRDDVMTVDISHL